MLFIATVGTGLISGCTSAHRLAGEVCISSAQCATGLLCDTTQAPAVCADKLGMHPDDFLDASTGYDFAGRDLSGVAPPDLSATPQDLSALVHDMATKGPDLAGHDGG
ncbi:MAG: hypothetical protein ABI321_14990 [Polyangia bacterium]